MVSREQLKDSTKSITSSVAGTFKSGVKNIKDDVTGSESGEYDVVYSKEADKWIILGPDNTSKGQFDKKRNAVARIKELKREDNTDSSAKSRFKDFATSFASSVNETVDGAATEATDTDEPEDDSQSMGFLSGGMDNEGGPSLPGGMSGRDSDGGGPMLPGGMGMGEDEQDGGPTMPGMSGGMGGEGGPQFPGFGDMGGKDGGEGPMLPDFGGGGGMGMPGFGMQEEDNDEEEETKPFGFKDY